MEETSSRVLNGLRPAYVPGKRSFALKIHFSLSDLEGGLVHMEELTWPLVLKPEAADAASATVKIARQISGRRKSAAATAASVTGPAIAARASAATTEVTAAAPARVARVSAAASAISATGAATAVPAVSATTSATAARTAFRGGGVHHAFVLGVASTGSFFPSAAQYLLHQTRVFRTHTRARRLLLIHRLETTPILRADLLHHHSQPPRRRTRMDRPFRPSRPRALSPTRPP